MSSITYMQCFSCCAGRYCSILTSRGLDLNGISLLVDDCAFMFLVFVTCVLLCYLLV